MKNSMKYIKLFENFEYLTPEDIFEKILNSINWEDYPHLNREECVLNESETFQDGFGVYGGIDYTGTIKLSGETDADWLPSFIYSDDDYQATFTLVSIYEIETSPEWKGVIDDTYFPDRTDFFNFTASGNENITGNFEFVKSFSYLNITNCENFTVFTAPIIEEDGYMEVFVAPNNNLLDIDSLYEVNVLKKFDCSNNNIVFFPAVGLEDTEVIKISDNPFLDDPNVIGYEWNLENSLNILYDRLVSVRLDSAQLKEYLESKDAMDYLFVTDKISDGVAKVLWKIVLGFYPDEIEKLLANCEAVGNWIPPDFLARMKRYDHSEYRDSKLDSEWKEVF